MTTTDTTAIAEILEVPAKKKRASKLSKLAPKAPTPPAPLTMAEAKASLRLLVCTYEDAREMSKKSKQRAGDYHDKETGELIRKNAMPEESKLALRDMADVFDKKADSLEAHMRRLLKHFPIYEVFLSRVRGVGIVTAAKLLADLDIHRAEKVSALQRVCGLAVWVNEDGQGKAQRARAGEKLDFHARLKVGLFQAFSALQKDAKRNESPYFRRLVEYKHRLQTGGRYDEATNTFDGRKGGKAIVHNMAWRPAAQLLIEHLYIVWRTLEGLPVWPSYEAVKLGYGHGGKVVVNAPKMLTIDEALAVVGMAPVAADAAAE